MDVLFLTTFGKAFIPKKMRPHLRRFFEKTGTEEVPYHLFGLGFWIAATVAYFFYITQVYASLRGKEPVIFFIVSFIVFAAVMLLVLFALFGLGYFWLNMKIYKRTKEMEMKLPEYLTLVSTSLKGGYSFEKALWGAIKPEFGILAKEIGLVSKQVMTGNDVTEALMNFAQKYNSPILRRNINLICGEIESGGKIVDVIDKVIINLKKTKALKEEMAAATLTYTIFIAALVMFVMPALFALSFTLFNVITGFLQNITSSMASSPVTAFKLSKSSIDPADYKLFTYLTITIISCTSALIISIIENGDIRAGLKYISLFLITSLSLYFVFLKTALALFGGIIPTP